MLIPERQSPVFRRRCADTLPLSHGLRGWSLIRYLPRACSICWTSRQSAGFRFFSQKIHAVHVEGIEDTQLRAVRQYRW